MADANKREFVAAMYNGQGWKRKVAQMDDAQVTAIYLQHERAQEKQKPRPPHDNEDAFPFNP